MGKRLRLMVRAGQLALARIVGGPDQSLAGSGRQRLITIRAGEH